LWARFKAGDSFRAIGQALGKRANTVRSVVAWHGGVAPPVRRRARQALTPAEREAISRGLAAGTSLRQIATALGRAPSTISREITRNGGAPSYRALAADARAGHRAKRPKACRLAQHAPLQAVVAAKLAAQWSPQQIAGWLVSAYPDDAAMQVSHETIYRTLFVQARGALKRELTAHLRTRRPIRRSKRATKTGQSRGQIVDAVSIAERPPCIEDRAIPGHWEGDLLAGARNTHIATLVERRSRYVHLVRVRGKDTTTVVNALIRAVQRLPAGLMASLTWDRGLEMAQHHRFSVATAVAVYFCDPQSPWQRGTNENTNGLLRQYFPDGTDLAVYTQRDLDHVAFQLNTRPRKTLGYRTPAAILAEGVAPTD
jgi:IS30 family transposase